MFLQKFNYSNTVNLTPRVEHYHCILYSYYIFLYVRRAALGKYSGLIDHTAVQKYSRLVDLSVGESTKILYITQQSTVQNFSGLVDHTTVRK